MFIEYGEDILLENNNYNQYPNILIHEYNRILAMLDDGQTSGILLQIKDMFEILLKLPILMGMSEIYNGQEWKEEDKRILYFLVQKPLSLGDWLEIGNRLSKNKDINPNIKELIEKITKIYNKYYLVQWRNINIGHGALKLDTDKNFITDIKEKIDLITEYLNNETIANIYSNVSISIDEKNKTDLDRVQKINIFNKSISMLPYIFIEGKQVYFYDTYYSRKKKTQMLNYSHGIKKDAHRKIHNKVVNLYQKLQRDLDLYDDIGFEDQASLDDSAYFQIERVILEEISKEEDIIKPIYLEKWIKTCLEDEKGIYLLQMERGMGKSIFSRALDELDDNSIRSNDTNVRAYYFNDTYRSKATTFAAEINSILKRGKKAKDSSLDYEIEALEGEIEGIHTGLRDKSKAMAKFLNTCSIKRRKRLLLILDGVDEIPSDQIKEIFDFIPEVEEIPNNIHILITSRIDEELEAYTRKELNKIKFTNKLEIKRESKDNIELLKNYINKKILKLKGKEIDDLNRARMDRILELCENRFLYLNTLKEILTSKDNIDIDEILETQEDVFLYYIYMLKNYYGEKYFYHIKKLLSILAIAYEPLTIRELAYLMGEEKGTFKLLGFLKDIRAFVKVERSNRESNVISINHKRIIQIIRKSYSKEIKEIIYTWYSMFLAIENNQIEDASLAIYDGEYYLIANILYHIKFYLKFYKTAGGFTLNSGDFKKAYNLTSAYLYSNNIKNYQLDRGILAFSNLLDFSKFLEADLVARLYMNQGIFRAMKEEYGNSINDFLKSAEYIKNRLEKNHIENREFLSSNYRNLAISYSKVYQLKEALKYINQAISILEKLNKRKSLPSPNSLLETYIEKTSILEQLNRIEDAHKIITKAVGYVKELETSKTLENDRLLAFIYSERGKIGVTMKDYENAKSDYERASHILERLEEEDAVKSTELINQYYLLGILHKIRGEFKEAINYHSQALKKIEELEKEEVVVGKSFIFTLYNSRGEMYFHLKKYSEAIADFNKAIEIFEYSRKNIGMDMILIFEYLETYMNRGASYLYEDKYQMALDDMNYFIKYKEELLNDLIEENKNINIRNLLKGYCNRAEILIYLDKKRAAGQDYKRFLELKNNKKYADFTKDGEISFLENRLKDLLKDI